MNKYQKLINQITRGDLNKAHEKGLYLSVTFRDMRKIHRATVKGQSFEFLRRYRNLVKGNKCQISGKGGVK